MFKYTLYEIKIVNKIPMWTFIACIYAENIIEAEFKAQGYQQQGLEYIITTSK